MARRPRRFVRPPAKTKIWFNAGVGSTALAGSSVILITKFNAAALALRPFTILRTHLQINVRSDQVTASENVIASFGETVVTDNASTIGVTAIPDPSGIDGDGNADWMTWQAMFGSFFIDINGTDGIAMSGYNGQMYVVDSKAMRKIGPNDDLVQVASLQTSPGLTFSCNGRRLVQLH